MHRAKRSFLVDTCAPACAANCALHSAVFVIDKSWPSLVCWATKKTMMLGDIIGKIIQFDVKYFKYTDIMIMFTGNLFLVQVHVPS